MSPEPKYFYSFNGGWNERFVLDHIELLSIPRMVFPFSPNPEHFTWNGGHQAAHDCDQVSTPRYLQPCNREAVVLIGEGDALYLSDKAYQHSLSRLAY